MDERVTETWRAFSSDAFAGEVCVVTGAASGMGLECARAFAAMGASVVLIDRNEEGVCSAAARVAGSLALAADVTSETEVESAFATAEEHFGRIDHVVHYAAVITATHSREATSEHWNRVLEVNLVGAFIVAKATLRRLEAQGSGTLVLVSSDSGFRGGGGLVADSAYAASKSGVLSLVKSLAREFAATGVRINALVPGPSDTPMHAALPGELKQRIAGVIPVGRMGRPDDMASAALFLSSRAASFVHGAALDVDGGLMMR